MISEIMDFNKRSIQDIKDTYLSPDQVDLKMFDLIIYNLNKSKCKYILIESDYIDRDFSDDYSAYYSKLFLEIGKKCCRIHFFSDWNNHAISSLFGKNREKILLCPNSSSNKQTIQKIDKDRQDDFYSLKLDIQKEFNDGIVKVNLCDLEESYLGFIVILPIISKVIGRTVIKYDVFFKNGYYCTSKCKTSVNIEGIPLILNSMPFIQQDERSGVCSSTSIWMVTCYMNLRYGFQRASLSKITEMANMYHKIDRPFPALRGLMPEQIITSLDNLGYNTIHYQKRTFFHSKWNPKEIIYKYIESGLPIIIGIGGKHVCVVIGHNIDLNRNISYEKEKENKILSNSSFITYFIVHDDLIGPYQLLPVEFSHPPIKKDDFDPFEDSINTYTPYTALDITNIIIPVFKKVYLEGQVIETMISKFFSSDALYAFHYYKYLINNFFSRSSENIIEEETANLGEDFLCKLSKKEVFYRSFFSLSNHIKEDYLLYKSSVSFFLRNYYSIIDLPRYIWLTEFFYEKEFKASIFDNGKNSKIVIGEILIDATGNDELSSIIAVHLPGILFVNSMYAPKAYIENNDIDKDFLAYEIPKDTSYELYDRERASNFQRGCKNAR